MAWKLWSRGAARQMNWAGRCWRILVLSLGVAVGSTGVVRGQGVPLPLGTVHDPVPLNMPGVDCSYLDGIDSDTSPGTSGPTQTCYSRTVTGCTDVPNLTAEIRVTNNPGTDGTILFFSATGGRVFWAPPYDETDPDGPNGVQHEHQLHIDLTTGANDYRLVEFAFQGTWKDALQGQSTGQLLLACRVATFVDWVETKLQFHAPGTPFCATGQSGGGNQLAYPLTHYGLDSKYDGVVFTSGPLYSDLQKACGTSCDFVPPDVDYPYPNTIDGCMKASSRWGVDQSYGQPDSPTFQFECSEFRGDFEASEECGETNFTMGAPCMQHRHENPATQFDEVFFDNSIALDPGLDYDYGDLEVRFLFGSLDFGPAPEQQRFFFEAVDHNSGVPTRNQVIGVGHNLPNDPDGRDELLADLLEVCVP